MTDYYMDTDVAAGDSSGDSWTNAVATLEALITAMSNPGDRGFIMAEQSDDTAAATRTFTSPGTVTNPCQFIGVKHNTSNEPPVLSDYSVRGTDVLAQISCTGGASDLTFAGAGAFYYGLHFTCSDRPSGADTTSTTWIGCKFTFADRPSSGGYEWTFINCELETTGTQAQFGQTNTIFQMFGGVYTTTTNPNEIIRSIAAGKFEFTSVDFSDLDSASEIGGAMSGKVCVRLRNCIMPATFTLASGAMTSGSIEVIASDSTTSRGATATIQDYQFEDPAGTVDLETTVVRTDGASDGANLFSYAMLPKVNATLESVAAIKSPWLSKWVVGGSTTAKIHVTHDDADSGGADLNQNDMWVEYFTTDPGDNSIHDHTFVCTTSPTANIHDDERLFPSSTASGTDDTTSTWVTHNTYKRSFDLSFTGGFTGWIYARVHFAKRYASTPVTLYVDPIIVIT